MNTFQVVLLVVDRVTRKECACSLIALDLRAQHIQLSFQAQVAKAGIQPDIPGCGLIANVRLLGLFAAVAFNHRTTLFAAVENAFNLTTLWAPDGEAFASHTFEHSKHAVFTKALLLYGNGGVREEGALRGLFSLDFAIVEVVSTYDVADIDTAVDSTSLSHVSIAGALLQGFAFRRNFR